MGHWACDWHHNEFGNSGLLSVQNTLRGVISLELERLNGQSWYAVYTHVNFEERVASALEAQGFEVYLPMLRCWDRRKGTLTWKPAFPRYLFVHCLLTPSEWRAIKKTRGVLQFVGMEKPEPIPEEEIRSGSDFVGSHKRRG
jgi:transcription antitermination factor NusG